MHLTDRLEAYIAEIQQRFPGANPADVFVLARETINFELDVEDRSFRRWLANEEERVNGQGLAEGAGLFLLAVGGRCCAFLPQPSPSRRASAA